ncbi:MAG TPA: MFS transporter [Candidatus Dormibacteraeota bacterium]|nr:MFS transporter [Candidatus Dormibacteraeota bacterium]
MSALHSLRAGATARGGRGHAETRGYRWWALSSTSLGALLAALNMSTLVIALPDLMRSLHIGVLDVTWVLLSYMLAQTAAVLTVGRLGDMWGRKRLFVTGFLVFTATALLCGFAGNAWELILLRALGGIGGALMVANSSAIVTDAFPKQQLGLALGINGMVVAVGSAVGPVLGGWLTSLGWQWVFWFNVPVAVVGSVWAWLVLREPVRSARRQRIDWLGNLVFLAGLSGLLLFLSMGGILGWTQPEVVGGGVAFAVGLPLFLHIERHAAEPLLDLGLFRSRIFAIGNLSQVLNATSRMGLLFLLVFYFQGPQQRDPVTAGLLVTPLAALMFLASPVSGWISDRIGSRIPATLGLALTGVGLAVMGGVIGHDTSYPLLAVGMGLVGMGAGIFTSPNASSIMAAVRPEQRGVASGVRMLTAFVGSMFSIAFVLAIITSALPTAVMLKIFSGVTTGLSDAQVDPFIAGVRVTLFVLAAISFLSAPLSLLRGKEEIRRRTAPVAEALQAEVAEAETV